MNKEVNFQQDLSKHMLVFGQYKEINLIWLSNSKVDSFAVLQVAVDSDDSDA